MKQKQIRDYVLEARLSKEQINEEEFKMTIPEDELLRKAKDTVKWLEILLKDQKRKLEPKWQNYWDKKDIQDTIKNVEVAIKNIKYIIDDLDS